MWTVTPTRSLAAAMLFAVVAFFCLLHAPFAQAQEQRRGPESGFVGMEIQDADLSLRQALGLAAGRGGIMVRDLTPGGPADLAGFIRGELITGFEGVPVDNLRQVVAYMQSTKPEQTLRFEIWRNGEKILKTLTLGTWPDGWQMSTNAVGVVPRLGITLVSLTPEVRESVGLRWGRTGVLVRSLDSDAPALAYGLEAGDLVVAVGRTPIVDPADVDGLLAAMGDEWFLLVERDNQVHLVGPNVGKLAPVAETKVPVVVGDVLLVASLSDGPYVMDRDLDPSGKPVTAKVGQKLAEMPLARPFPAEGTVDIPGLGLSAATITQERKKAMRLRWSSRGVVITKVVANSTAQRAGLAPGHVITAINGRSVTAIGQVEQWLKGDRAGDIGGPSAVLVEARNGFFLASLTAEKQAGAATQTTDFLKRFEATTGSNGGAK